MKLVPLVQGVVRSMDQHAAVQSAQTLDAYLKDVAADATLRGQLLSCFGLLEVILNLVEN